MGSSTLTPLFVILFVFIVHSVSCGKAVPNPGPAAAGTSYAEDWPLFARMLQKRIPKCNDIARVWVRLFFHDAGTWNNTSKKGGLDGSIRYELNRTENRGLASEVMALSRLKRPRVSLADLIALAGGLAVRVCGGPVISFTPGRVDATAANGEDLLPGPREELDEVRGYFRRMGFTSDRPMVALIGGGHTIGRVSQANSPDAQLPPYRDIAALDVTPDGFDQAFFRELLTGRVVPFKLGSDLALLDGPETRRAIADFAVNRQIFFTEFVAAWQFLQDAPLPLVKKGRAVPV